MTQLVNNSCILVLYAIVCYVCLPRTPSAPPHRRPICAADVCPSAFVRRGEQGLQGDERWAAVAASLPNDAFTVTTNCGRNRRQNRLANTLFWLDLTIFRMNTCAKRVGGWGCRFSTFTLTPRGECGAAPFTLSLEGLALRIEGSWRRVAFKGAVSPCHDPGRRAIAPPARLRYSAAQGSGENF
jgi:hypothetical protein